MTLTLAPGAMTRRLRAARLGVIRSYALADGTALRVFTYGRDEARAIAAHLIGLGYDAAATGDRVTVTLPEPTEETVEERLATIVEETEAAIEQHARHPQAHRFETPAPTVKYRQVGEGLYEVVADGQAVGRVARTTPAHVRLSGARWASYTTTGERVASGSYTRDDACDRLLGVLADRAREAQPAPVVTVEQLVADTLNLGYRTVAEYLAAPGREVGQVTPWTLDRAERALARKIEETRLHDDPPAPVVAEGLVHLMSDALLDACGTAGPGGLHLAPSTTPERITCPACRILAEEEAAADAVVEADLPPTDEERVTLSIPASSLRPGDLVVDSLGNREYAVFDVAPGEPFRGIPQVRVWTAIADQERGLPPVLSGPAGREVRVLRPVSEEGRELLAALDRPTESTPPAFGSPAWALSLLPENRHA